MIANPMSMPLAWRPESPQAMQARFQEAMLVAYTVQGVMNGETPAPGQQARHVFDFEAGLRLVAYVEKTPIDGRLFIHLSVSVARPSSSTPANDEALEQEAWKIAEQLMSRRGASEKMITGSAQGRAVHLWFLLGLPPAEKNPPVPAWALESVGKFRGWLMTQDITSELCEAGFEQIRRILPAAATLETVLTLIKKEVK